MQFLLMLPSGGEMIIILFAVLLLFGGKKIPELMRGLGRGIREFNDARDSVKKSLDESVRMAEKEANEKKKLAQSDFQEKPAEVE